ncbi:MAG TPA: glutamate-cysteine ligase family protein [Noviherbaspirillum sp.]|nr:glutamate-cysteine ligase family protein [Noviherbaspirillum sp.]
MNDEDAPPPLPAFAGYGIELEYMIVDERSLSVLPLADRLLHQACDGKSNEAKRGLLDWSNELVLHVIEIKNPRPAAALSLLPDHFQSEIRAINRMLQTMGARLMPGAMHPWMTPRSETHLWPHDNHAIYHAYDRIFDTKSHGWANLQSMHINLPFADDAEFARLHAAIRLVLPILPALAASSPIADGGDTGWLDYRMHVYCDNAQAFPAIAGKVVPETVTSRAAYEQRILAPMYRAIAPHDPDGILQQEWLNSRGAIARFDRNAIEIRVVDTQECPRADLAIAAAATATIRRLYRRGDDDLAAQQAQQEIRTDTLATILQDCIRNAEQATIEHAPYLQLLGYPEPRCTADALWQHLVAGMMDDDPEHALHWRVPLQTILEQGPLARRILRALNGNCSRQRLQVVYRELCNCLDEGRMFSA